MSPNLNKEEKYDRQLRLWAKDGQSRLEKCHVCLLNATPTGAEALKNLVLPGIGAFTIVDERTITKNDLSGNFFLEDKDIGMSFAERTAKSLLELNPSVECHNVRMSAQDCLTTPDFFESFDMVLVSDYLPLPDLLVLKERLWLKNIPLLHVSTCGFYGSLQIFCNETTIVETHDPSQTYDLRIDKPWPALQEYADSFNLEALDDTEHAHVPYIIIFIKALESWKDNHGGCIPRNYDEKRAFKVEYIERLARDIRLEANFGEATQQVHRALQVTTVPTYLKLLSQDPRVCDHSISEETPLFWIFIKALSSFVELHGALPLPGTLPDMVSNTSNYVKLQEIYRRKALEDQEEFASILRRIFATFGKKDEVPTDLVAAFCKNSANLYYAKGTRDTFSNQLRDKMISCSAPVNTLAIHYGIHALHSWIYRGSQGDFAEFLDSFFRTLGLSSMNMVSTSCKEVLQEVFQHQTRGFHSTCSFMGGIVSQEILKIATAQYIPLDNLFVFDGIHSASEKWKV